MPAEAKSAEAKHADFVISRVFDAPRDLVWKCFTEPERMRQWFGPKGSVIVSSKMDLRVGGIYHGAMRDGRAASCGPSSSIARSPRRNAWSGCIRSRTKPAD